LGKKWDGISARMFCNQQKGRVVIYIIRAVAAGGIPSNYINEEPLYSSYCAEKVIMAMMVYYQGVFFSRKMCKYLQNLYTCAVAALTLVVFPAGCARWVGLRISCEARIKRTWGESWGSTENGDPSPAAPSTLTGRSL